MADSSLSEPKVIVITGGNSGIGAALAQEYAARGVVLGLLGRDERTLANIRTLCEAKGALVQTSSVDVTDAKTMSLWLKSFDAHHPIDLLIANAGISAGTSDAEEMTAITRKVFATNIDGVANAVLPVIPGMMKRGRGQIAIVSSLAGIRGLPSAPAYSASKAAVRFWGEGLRGQLGKRGVSVSVICPGYVRTPLTAVNTFPMPFIMEPEKAARIIRRGLEKNKARIGFPLALYLPLWFLSCLPPCWTDWFFARLPEK